MGRIEGDLSVMPLADVVIWLANRGMSGLLTVTSRTHTTKFDIEQGMVARASTNNPRSYFGQFLIHFGLLTEDQLQRAFETQGETEVLLGRILVMIGIVPEEQVIQTLRVKFVENMLGAMRWTEGCFCFEMKSPRVKHRPRIEVAVPLMDVHAEGLQRAEVWAEYERVIPSMATVFGVDERRISDLAARSLDGRIIEFARQGHSIEAISLELHATDYQVAVRVVELVRAGVLQPREPSVQVEIPDLTGDLPEQHLDEARSALANREFTSAFRHVLAGSKLDPDNPQFAQLRQELESRSLDSHTNLISRGAVPRLAQTLDPMQTRRMSAKQRYLLGRIDGRRNVQSIIQVSPMHDFEALDILESFCTDGIVELTTNER